MSRRISRARLALAASMVAGLALWAATPASAANAPACASSTLSAQVAGSAAGMSQPAVFISLKNTGTASCSLRGYPRLVGGWTADGREKIRVTTGPAMNVPEAPVKRIVLAPGASAWFAISSGTAYDPPVVTFTQFAFTVPGGGRMTVGGVGLPATAPKGKPYPLTVTPLAAGQPPAGG